ncbi:MAG: hypothetical protein GQ564_18680 [Bacteroidales bacterium]|nr:hypothetical protein [Bacteroidales bacterium]
MFKNILILLIIFLFNINLSAQDWNEIYYLDDDALFFVEEGEYEKAIDTYKKMLREISDYSLAKYKIGKLYLQTDDQKNLAISFLEEASKDVTIEFNEKSIRETKAPADAFLYLGEAYQINNQINKAIESYNSFKQLISSDHELYSTLIQKLKTCENAKATINKPISANFENLGSSLNDENSNFNAVLSGDGQNIIFTSYTKNYIDVYSSQKKDGVWSSPKKITDDVSDKFYLKTSSLSYDGTQLFLVTDDIFENEIFLSTKEGNSWTNAEKLGKTINGKKTNETHASISKSGNTLYFTSNREGGYGGLDIYKATLDAKGNWGEVENLGSEINTEFDEETPFITMDDKYLFFSSQGHNSIGGFDIFYVDLGNKSQVINLGYPANTADNDLFFVPDNTLNSGYISRYENTSKGKNDIYYLSILQNINLAGIIKDKNSGNQITGIDFNISLINSETNTLIDSSSSNTGNFEFEITPGNYTLAINNKGYNSFSNQINIPDNYTDSKYTFEALLNPIVIEQEELIAEIVEKPKATPIIISTEPIVEETIVTTTSAEIIPEEIISEEKIETPPDVDEKTIEIPVKEPEPKPIKKEIKPEKEIKKYIPKESSGMGLKTFSVQLMALKKPVAVDYFKNVDNVKLTRYSDGYYRYTVGDTKSFTEAKNIKSKLREFGYEKTFIRVNESAGKYTIQIMALLIPLNIDDFRDLPYVILTKSADNYYRYTIGTFCTFEEAKEELNKLHALGYNQAFVKNIR